jgi:hypothetical protein
MGEKEPLDDLRVSHSICSACYTYFKEQVKGLSLDRYLNKFEAPIIIVNADGRIFASNKMAADMTGKSGQRVFGLLGGEAMECVYAKLPEGCGETVHCETCTIRKTVMAAMESEVPQLHMPVKLRQLDKTVNMVISTDKIGELVRIVIEEIN